MFISVAKRSLRCQRFGVSGLVFRVLALGLHNSGFLLEAPNAGTPYTSKIYTLTCSPKHSSLGYITPIGLGFGCYLFNVGFRVFVIWLRASFWTLRFVV